MEQKRAYVNHCDSLPLAEVDVRMRLLYTKVFDPLMRQLQVTIDSQGMLKAVHLVSMASTAETSSMAAPISYSAMPGSQVAAPGLVQFLLFGCVIWYLSSWPHAHAHADPARSLL